MNCFNIKEVQSLLRNKFIHETAYNRSVLPSGSGVISSLGSLTNRSPLPNTKHSLQSNYNPFTSSSNYTGKFSIMNLPNNPSNWFFNPIKSFTTTLFTIMDGIVYSTTHLFNYRLMSTYISILTSLSLITTFPNSNYSAVSAFTNVRFFLKSPSELITGSNLTVSNTQTSYHTNLTSDKFSFMDHPTVLYKIKTGNYLSEELTKVNFYQLFNTINYKTMLKQVKSNWFETSQHRSDLYARFNSFNASPSSTKFAYNKVSAFDVLNSTSVLFFSTKGLLVNSTYVDLLKSMNLELENLLMHQTKQSRILNNWRFLKLQREGWRCRMLSARHQRSMYRRYVNENEVIWVVEKNAKDLLPGWAMVTPFSSRTRYTLIGKTDIGISIVAITLIASMVSSANFLMTYRYLSTLNNRKMRDARSFFSESVIAASWMMIAANPMLILGLFMLLSDRH